MDEIRVRRYSLREDVTNIIECGLDNFDFSAKLLYQLCIASGIRVSDYDVSIRKVK